MRRRPWASLSGRAPGASGRRSSRESGTASPRRRRARRGHAAGRAGAPSRPRPCRARRRGPAASAPSTRPPSICSGSFVRRCPSCQIQWVSIAVTRPGAAAPTWVNIASETSKWLFECEPQVRPQSRQVCATRTEPAIVQKCGSASGMSTDCSDSACVELAPVGGDHVGRGRQAGGAAELGHHLAAGEAVLGAARVLGIGDDAAHVAHQPDRVLQQPAAVRVERDARLGEALVQGDDRLDLLLAAQHAALELEVVEAVARRSAASARRTIASGVIAFSWRRRNQSSSASGSLAYGRSVLRAVADVEQVAEHLDRVALLAFAEQRRDRHVEVLAEQVEQRRLDRGDRVDRGAQVEGLQAAAAARRGRRTAAAPPAAGAAARRAAGRRPARAASSSVCRIFSPPGTSPTPVRPALSVRISEVAGEERAVRAAQVEQHAVATGDGNDPQRRDGGGGVAPVIILW